MFKLLSLRSLYLVILCSSALPILVSGALAEPADSAINFTGKEFYHGGVVTSDEYRGGLLYLDFWASWCRPCAESLPFLDKLKQKHRCDSVNFVAVNIDENKQDAVRFLYRHPVGLTMLYDPLGDIAQQFRVRVMPTAILLDADGKVLLRHTGFDQDYAERLEKLLQNLIEQAPARSSPDCSD